MSITSFRSTIAALAFVVFSLLFPIATEGQVITTFDASNPIESSVQNCTAYLYQVRLFDDYTEVAITLVPNRDLRRLRYWSSRSTRVEGPGFSLPLLGALSSDRKTIHPCTYDANWGWDNAKRGQIYRYTLVFEGRIPCGITTFNLKDSATSGRGFGFSNYKINNPDPCEKTGLSEYSIKKKADEDNDGIVGIYEQVGENKYKLGCVHTAGTYKLVYLNSGVNANWWHVGDVKAILRETATPGSFKANWYMLNKTVDADTYVFFDGGSMKVIIDGEESMYLKMYPTSSSSIGKPGQSSSSEWSGSGFALKGKYVVTNYHVIEGAKTIKILGINGSFSTEYSASVAATDKSNDLALIKIDDYRFSSFGNISYSIKTGLADVGEDVFVLGYPLTTVMGDEIKLTTGVISSRTGFQGDISTYQISAPIQPGNSGGPLFDANGNIIGIVNAKISAAENVGYAIKASYLRNLVESYISSDILPSTNSVASLSRPNQIKSLRNFVFLIKCSSK